MKRSIVLSSLVLMTAVGCSYATDSSDGGVDSGLPLVPVARIEVNARRYGDLPGLANADSVAMRDGQGPWQVVEGVGGTYALPVTDAKGQFSAFVVCPGLQQGRQTFLVEATLAELPLTPVPCLANSDSDAGILLDTNATIAVGNILQPRPEVYALYGTIGGALGFDTRDGTAYSRQTHDVPAGYYDVIAYGGTQDGTPVDAWIAHHQRVQDTTTFSFDLLRAPLVETAQVTITPAVANIQVLTHSSFLSTRYADPVVLTTGTTGRVTLFPNILLDEGDFSGILTRYADSPTSQRGHLRLTKTPSDFTIPLPAPFTGTLIQAATGTAGPGAATTAFVFSYSWSGGPPNAGFALEFIQPNLSFLAWVSPASLAGASNWSPPDLSQIPGWEVAWGLTTGVPTTWTALNLGGGAAGWRQGVRLLPYNLGAFTEAVDADSAQTTETFTP